MYQYEILEEEYYNKIINNENLTEDELRYLKDNYEVSADYGENRRWMRSVASIIQLKDKHFEIDWEEGLTECQEDYFYNQPYEVKLIEYEKTITIREWAQV